MSTQPVVAPHAAKDFMPLHGIDHVELWVGNAKQAAHYYTRAFGFQEIAYAGLETGMRDRTSHVLKQGRIRLVLTGALTPNHEIAQHHAAHGDGAKVIALSVPDAAYAYHAAVERGATGVREPWEESDEHGTVRFSTIAAYGETVHTFVDRTRYAAGLLEPGYTTERLPNPVQHRPVGLTRIDHIVGNVAQGELADWVRFYADVLGFATMQHFDDDQIRTEYSALMSTVVWDGSKIVMPINEPAEGLKKSQIQEYIEHYDGAGVQHLALCTDDIVATVQELRDRGVRFMEVPEAYYAEARERLAAFDLPWAELQRLHILADHDEEGYLLQIFTETVTDRPAVFFEIIQRCGARGFGEGNFKALFEAIERDQERRGNL